MAVVITESRKQHELNGGANLPVLERVLAVNNAGPFLEGKKANERTVRGIGETRGHSGLQVSWQRTLMLGRLLII